MKILNVSEILTNLEVSINKKEAEKEQVLSIHNSLNNIIELNDSLKGRSGDAIKEHFITLHIPAILLLNQFLDNYIKKLKDIKALISKFEEEDGVIRQDFIEQEVQDGLRLMERLTEEKVSSINKEIIEVSDIIGGQQISLDSFYYCLTAAITQCKNTIEELQELDDEGLKKITDNKNELEHISTFIRKIETWSKNEITLTPKTVKEIEKFLEDSDEINKLIQSALELSIKQNDSTFAGGVADWLDKIGKLNGALDAVKGSLSATILLSKRIRFVKDGLGNFKVIAHPDWVKGVNNQYGSKLADAIHKILKKGSSSSISFVRQYM
ncbi:LXG domain-containing protein [Bacillaceae bacterium Marseille-Q3522]|nr:LXG domain-containing protein [Bacillaceae bacterium Marseille-Q3522]